SAGPSKSPGARPASDPPPANWRHNRVCQARSCRQFAIGSDAMAKPPILTPQATDFPRWYQDVVAKAELAEIGPVRGTMVIRPWGWAISERMQSEVDRRIRDAGASNADFPLLIRES